MKKYVKIILLSLFSFFLINLNEVKAEANTITVSGTLNYDYAKKVVDLVNKERQTRNLTPVEIDNDLVESAMTRAIELIIYYNHTRPNGELCFSINDKIFSENIAIGYNMTNTPAEAVNVWMNSTGHRENILNASNKSMGVGVVKYGNYWYWVQIFSPLKATNTNLTKSGWVDVNNKEVEVTDEFVNYDFAYPNTVNNTISLNSGTSLAPNVHKFHNMGWSFATYDFALKAFTYKIDDTTIAKVANDGTITAYEPGSTTLRVSLGGVEKSFPIEVKADVREIDATNMTIYLNEEKELKYQILPSKATVKNVTITSSNENIVKVINGKLKGVNTGSADITITIDSLTKTISKKIKVTVVDYKKGDINEDKTVDVLDAREALYIAVGKATATPKILLIGDMDANNKIEANDAVEILRIYLEK